MHLRRKCILPLLSGMLYKYQLNLSGLLCHLKLVFPFLFSSLIAVAKTSKTMLNNSGESGQPCLVSDLSGNDFSFLNFTEA